MNKKRKLITFDWAIKRLLRSKANFGILEGFLSELLKEDITILDVLDSESNKDFEREGTEAICICELQEPGRQELHGRIYRVEQGRNNNAQEVAEELEPRHTAQHRHRQQGRQGDDRV